MPSQHTRTYDRSNKNNQHGEDRKVSRSNGYRSVPNPVRGDTYSSEHAPLKNTRDTHPSERRVQEKTKQRKECTATESVLRLLGVFVLLALLAVLCFTVIRDYRSRRSTSLTADSTAVSLFRPSGVSEVEGTGNKAQETSSLTEPEDNGTETEPVEPAAPAEPSYVFEPHCVDSTEPSIHLDSTGIQVNVKTSQITKTPSGRSLLMSAMPIRM